MKLHLSLTLFSISLLMGCATSTFNKIELEKVRKVAVVGFTYDYNLPIGKALLGGLMGKERKMGGPHSLMGKTQNKLVEKPVSKESYEYLVKNLQKMGWRVLSQKDSAKSRTLKKAYSRKVKVGTLPLESNHERYKVNGIEQFHYVHHLKKKNRAKKIAQELGVDALIFAYLNTDLTLTALGIGKTKYKTSARLEVYSPNLNKKIMFSNVQGRAVTKDKSGKGLARFSGSKAQYNTFRGSTKAVDQLITKMQNKMKK